MFPLNRFGLGGGGFPNFHSIIKVIHVFMEVIKTMPYDNFRFLFKSVRTQDDCKEEGSI